MRTESITCLRCGSPTTLGLGQTHLCLRCGSQWTNQPTPHLDVFDQTQLERLRVYRAAIRAGLYSEFKTLF
jgi:hypothetical protein